MSNNNNNSRIRVIIHEHEDDEILVPPMYIMINDRRPRLRNAINNLFNQPVFNPGSGLSPYEEINNALNQVQMLDVMTGFFGDMMEGGYGIPLGPRGGGYDSVMEDRMMRVAMRESLNHYKTQEKKPNIKLDVKSQLATSDHKDNTCAICKSDFEVDENITLLSCDHIFHTDCIAEWVKYKSECPVCRSKIETTDTTEKKSSESGPGEVDSEPNDSDDDMPVLEDEAGNVVIEDEVDSEPDASDDDMPVLDDEAGNVVIEDEVDSEPDE